MSYRPTALAAAIALALPALSHAEELPVFVGDEIIVTAARFPAKIKEEPASVSVLTRKDIEANPSATLPELLATLPGVQIRNNSGTPEFMVDLRGFGMTGNQNTLVLLDGQRLNENELVSIKWTSIPTESIERIEVIRGAGAVMYGGGATGGVINIITRKPAQMKNLKTVAIAGGSYGLKEASAYLSGASEISWSLAANVIDTDNYRENNALTQKNLQATLQLSEWTVRAGVEAQDLELPGARSRAQLASNPRGTATPNDYATRDSGFVTAGWNRQMDNGRASVDASYRQNNRTALFDLWGSYLDTDNRSFSLNPRMELGNTLFGNQGTLVLGLDADYWDYDSKRYSTFGMTLGVDISASQRNLSAYARQSLKLGQGTTMTLGGRVQNTRSEAQDHASTQAYAKGSRSDTPWAAEIGLKQELGHGFAAFGRAGHSFRVATVDEMYDQFGGPDPFYGPIVRPLKPQTSNEAELGLQYSDNSLSGRASIYGMNLRDEIHFNAISFTNQNLAPTRRYGFETEAEYRLSPSLKLSAGYAYTVAKFRKGIYNGFDAFFNPISVDVSGNDLPLVPRHSASLTASWQPVAGQQLSLAARYVGKQRFDNDQANNFVEQMPDYTIVDLKWQGSWKNWKAFAAINNLLDEEYFSYAVRSPSSSNFNAYPMPERNYRIGLEYMFK